MELVLMLAVTLDCILCHVVGPGYYMRLVML